MMGRATKAKNRNQHAHADWQRPQPVGKGVWKARQCEPHRGQQGAKPYELQCTHMIIPLPVLQASYQSYMTVR
jgi:hypothetical protein